MSNKFPFFYRLHHSDEFDNVFRSTRLVTKWFTLYHCNNELSRPRLGLVVTKRLFASAVVRNRIKRISRECFRHVARDLTATDFVVRINKVIKNKEDGYFFCQMLSAKLAEFKIKND